MKTKNSIKSTVKRVARLIGIVLMYTTTLTISCKLGVDAVYLLEIHGVIDSISSLQQIITFIMIGGIINGLLNLALGYCMTKYKQRQFLKMMKKHSLIAVLLIAFTSCESKLEPSSDRWRDLNNKIEELQLRGGETDEYLYLRDLLNKAKTDSALNVVEMQYELVVK